MAEIKDSNYTYITSIVSTFKPDIIYIGISSALGWHSIEKITPNLNQQYPPFLNKFDKKLIILIDQCLEEKLVLESKMDLTCVLKSNKDEIKMRIFNTSTNDKIIALNQHFYFDNIIQRKFLFDLISYTLETNTKMIVNDYSGRDIHYNYVEILDKFPKEKILNSVLFDITQNDGGCYFDFNDFPIHYDDKNNFIQFRYKSLAELKKISMKKFKVECLKRISWINYELTRQLRVLQGEIAKEKHSHLFENQVNKIVNFISIIYTSVKKEDISEDNIKEALLQLLIDICNSLEVSSDLINFVQKNNYKQNIVNESTGPLKFMINDI